MWHYFQSPIGVVQCNVSKDKVITACYHLLGTAPDAAQLQADKELHPELAQAIETLSGVPIGYRVEQRIPTFAPNFWTVLQEIPFGTLVTYSQLTTLLGLPKTYARAVGNWLGKNECFLLLPCHRVVGANGELGGFRWGAEHKRRLICFEKNATV